MASAYTPGLTVSADVVIRRSRRLPIKGEVLCKIDQDVEPDTPVARALLPGNLQTFKLSEKLGVDASDLPTHSPVQVGQKVSKGEMLFETKGILGFFKQKIYAETSGTIESISEITGNALIRESATPVEILAYVKGKIVEIMENEGAVVETRCAMVQGIFGVGGERTGTVTVKVASPDQPLSSDSISPQDAGKIIVGGSSVSGDALKKACECNVTGIIVGGIRDADLIDLLGYDIGVAITGSEQIPLTIVVTEGFGTLAMANRTFELLQTLEGRSASINGATQIRAGVIRPELLAPIDVATITEHVAKQAFELSLGTSIRIIREPYFGTIGEVVELPAQLMKLESGTVVRVLVAKLKSGESVTVPRANVEILAQ